MRGFSKAIIAGNLTRDPELRTTTNGSTVCSFSVAVNRTYRDANGEQKEEVSYIDCSAWAKPDVMPEDNSEIDLSEIPF